jgi:branched-chain amino acid transport system permease protein
MQRFGYLTVDGLASGAVYATFALSLVLIWRAGRIVNFAQGAIAVASAYLAWSVTAHTHSYWLGFVAALAGGALLGVVVERGVMRFVPADRPMDAVIVAVGVMLVVQGVLGMLYGADHRPVPAPLPTGVWRVGGVATVSPYQLFVVGAVAVLVAALALLFTRTRLGLRLRAAAFAPEVARLLGVRVARMTTVAWALASAAGALAAMLVLPSGLGLTPTAMDGVFITAFTAAVIGGLDSAVGAVVGGLAVGVVVNYVTGYAGNPNLANLAVLALLVIVLLVRPGGLFSGVAVRRA